MSEIILCNADNSVIDNVTIHHADEQNNMIHLIQTDNSNITNVNLTNLQIGNSLSSSTNNTITNSYAKNIIFTETRLIVVRVGGRCILMGLLVDL